jgi:hypothetical protein
MIDDPPMLWSTSSAVVTAGTGNMGRAEGYSVTAIMTISMT